MCKRMAFLRENPSGPADMIPASCHASVHAKLTCAIWSRTRPRAVGQALACGRSCEEIAFHTRVHDGVGEGRSF